MPLFQITIRLNTISIMQPTAEWSFGRNILSQSSRYAMSVEQSGEDYVMVLTMKEVGGVLHVFNRLKRDVCVCVCVILFDNCINVLIRERESYVSL